VFYAYVEYSAAGGGAAGAGKKEGRVNMQTKITAIHSSQGPVWRVSIVRGDGYMDLFDGEFRDVTAAKKRVAELERLDELTLPPANPVGAAHSVTPEFVPSQHENRRRYGRHGA
jgi:hypothetical protein